MKRTILYLTLATAAVFASASIGSAQSSVPNLINFQGKLLDNLGNPVADGAHNFTFRIYDAAVAGTLRWTEGPVALSTADGLFNHQLGSGTAFPQTLFQDYDELYLEIEADAEIQLPRTRLISTPYTRVANNLEVRSLTTDTVAIRTIPSAHQLSTYGSDGKEQIRLWGMSSGEIFLYDADATNDNTVRLRANSSSGGELELTNDAGALTIDLHGGLTGDASVDVPNDAVSALEILNEPGVASNTYDGSAGSGIVLDGTVQTLLSRTITVPAAGYVLVISTCQTVTVGSSSAIIGVSDVAGSFPANQDVATDVSSSLRFGVTVQGLFSVSAGAHTFYSLAQEQLGDVSVFDVQFTLAYFPTAYGTVLPTLPSSPSKPSLPEGKGLGPTTPAMTAADVAAEQAEAQMFNTERIARELAGMKVRMQKLEEQLQQNQNAVINEQ